MPAAYSPDRLEAGTARELARLLGAGPQLVQTAQRQGRLRRPDSDCLVEISARDALEQPARIQLVGCGRARAGRGVDVDLRQAYLSLSSIAICASA
jgi:hypothetical protein